MTKSFIIFTFLFCFLGVCAQEQQFKGIDKKAVVELYKSLPASGQNNYLQISKTLTLEKGDHPRHFLIHPHLHYDRDNLLKGKLETLLVNNDLDSYVILEGLWGKTYTELLELERGCQCEEALSVKECLDAKFGIFNPANDITLSTFGNADVSIGAGGGIGIDGNGWNENENIIVTGGYFRQCLTHSVVSILTSFVGTKDTKNLSIHIPTSLSIHRTTTDNEIQLLQTFLDNLNKEESTWKQVDFANWYLNHLKSRTLSNLRENKESNLENITWQLAIDNKVIYEEKTDSEERVISINLPKELPLSKE